MNLAKLALSLVLLLGLGLMACNPGVTEPEIPGIITSASSPPPAGIIISPQATAGQVIQAEHSPTATQTPTRVTSPNPDSIFLISWDGAGAELVHGLMESGYLPHFEALSKSGVRAEYALSVDPPLTAPAHISMASGSIPARTGIVSNRFHVSADSFYWYRSGFYEPMDQAEPIWLTASRAGLSTATVFFPGASPDLAEQTADLTIGYGVRDAYGSQQTVILGAALPWQEAPPSFSLLHEGSFHIPEVARLYLLVLDSSDDGISNYDTVFINTSPSVDENALQLTEGQWGSLVLLPESTAGADFLIQKINPGQILLYHTAVNHNTASPPPLLEALNRSFGFFPASPDMYALEKGWITEDNYLDMISRSSSWMAEVAAWVYTVYRPNLLMTWQGVFDDAGHVFSLLSPLQQGYSPERAALYRDYYHVAAATADRSLEIMLRPLDQQHTTIFLVSDHGTSAVHTRVNLNTLLEQAGLLVLDRKNYVVVERTRAMAVTSGGSVNIYINLAGRERNGIVSPEGYPAVMNQLVDLLAGLNDPETGQPVFQRVLARDELIQLGLHHPNSGDLFAQAYPGYELDGWRGKNSIFEQAVYNGAQGYDCSLPDMQAFFIAAGGGIPAGGKGIPSVRLIDYAPTIAALFGFEPARSVDGMPIAAILLP